MAADATINHRNSHIVDYQIQGLRVLVTAGASGIGLATARAFASEGARVFTCDIDRAALAALATSDPHIGQIECDVARPDAVAHLVDTAAKALGGIDALVNNAGIAGPTAPCEEIALADWQHTLAVDLTGTFVCTQRAIPWLKASANPSIANLSSAAGRFGFPNRSAYAAAKWGVIGFTKSIAMELGDAGVRVNAICPGSVAGPRIESVYANKARLRGVPPSVVMGEALAKTSLKRLVSPDDIAHLIVFLASPLGRNISGQALPVDADLHALV